MKIIGRKIQHIRSHQLHPYMFTLFCTFFLYSQNIGQLDVIPTLITAAYVLFTLTIFNLLTLVIIRDNDKVSLLTTVALVIFFSHGHVLDFVWGWELGGILIGRNLYLLIAWALIFIVATIFVIRSKSKLTEINKIVSVFTIGLLAIVLLNIGMSFQKMGLADTDRVENPGKVSNANSSALELPDIYYIILDGYTNQSNMKQYYGYDNKEFVNFLQQNKFHISATSHSNYATTFLSLTSSLNMNYLNEYFSNYETNPKVARQLAQMVEKNAVIMQLKQKGYKIAHFSSGYGSTNYNKYADWNISLGRLNEFARMLVHSSILRLIEDRLVEGDARNRILRSFDMLGEVQHKIRGPRFVFAHIVCPHPPYLFNAEGNPANNTPQGYKPDGLEMWQLKKPYVEQVKFVNTKLQHIVTKILAEATTPPIIIIQGDHGTASTGGWSKPTNSLITERLGILNAYYLPGDFLNKRIDSITPVNTFRIIFNTYLGTHYEVLPDRMYFSTYEAFSKLKDVTNIILDKDHQSDQLK